MKKYIFHPCRFRAGFKLTVVLTLCLSALPALAQTAPGAESGPTVTQPEAAPAKNFIGAGVGMSLFANIIEISNSSGDILSSTDAYSMVTGTFSYLRAENESVGLLVNGGYMSYLGGNQTAKVIVRGIEQTQSRELPAGYQRSIIMGDLLVNYSIEQLVIGIGPSLRMLSTIGLNSQTVAESDYSQIMLAFYAGYLYESDRLAFMPGFFLSFNLAEFGPLVDAAPDSGGLSTDFLGTHVMFEMKVLYRL